MNSLQNYLEEDDFTEIKDISERPEFSTARYVACVLIQAFSENSHLTLDEKRAITKEMNALCEEALNFVHLYMDLASNDSIIDKDDVDDTVYLYYNDLSKMVDMTEKIIESASVIVI